MGLDMYLYRHKKSDEVCYWRKANQIRNWFVNKGYPEDGDCDSLYVSKETLEELIDTCKKVLADHSLAKELLPTDSGFFFGSTDYDEWYYKQLEETITDVQKVVDETNWDEESVYYSDWW